MSSLIVSWPQSTEVTSLTSSHVSLPQPAGPPCQVEGNQLPARLPEGTPNRTKGCAKRRSRGGSNSRRSSRCKVWGVDGIGGGRQRQLALLPSSAAPHARQRARTEARASGSIKRAPCALSKQVIAWLFPRSRTVLTVEVAEHRANHKATQLICLIHAECNQSTTRVQSIDYTGNTRAPPLLEFEI